MDIKVLGPGCPNCHRMRALADEAVAGLGVEADVEYVTDVAEIMRYVTAMPGLVVNGKVKHAGMPLPSPDRVKALIQEEM
ncbi:MAG: thioredoxin family protein [Nitrospirae bacterium]|nr:thioredoxin family protein [Nitrospirota bacterium]